MDGETKDRIRTTDATMEQGRKEKDVSLANAQIKHWLYNVFKVY